MTEVTNIMDMKNVEAAAV